MFLDKRKKLVFTKSNDGFREFSPYDSKLSACIVKGLNVFLNPGMVVLYLGCSSGTTVSYVSDVVGDKGFIFGVDNSPRMIRDFVFLCEKRSNVAPVLADASNPESYKDRVAKVDWLFQDVSQRNQVDIFLKNIDLFLKKNSYCVLCIKSRSIDFTKKPDAVFDDVKKELSKHLEIIGQTILEPYKKDHCVFVCKRL